MQLNTFAAQDVDAAFMGKSDLQSKVDTLYGEINFLKYLFDTVSAAPFLFPHPIRVQTGAGSSRQYPPSIGPFPQLQCFWWSQWRRGRGSEHLEISEGEVVPCFTLSGHLGHEGTNQVFTHCGKSIGLWENPTEGSGGGEQDSVLPACHLCLTWVSCSDPSAVSD